MYLSVRESFKKRKRENVKLSKPVYQRLCAMGGGGLSLLLLLMSIITVQLAIALHRAPQPQAILTLGGGQGREQFTTQFARTHPALEIWVSSARYPEAPEIFRNAGIPEQRVHFNWYAVDTVSNFAFLVRDLQSRNIQHIYLITSDYHMPRAGAIATLILGSQGIAFTPISIPSSEPPESWLPILRDSGRAVFWIVTGKTGANLTKLIKK